MTQPNMVQPQPTPGSWRIETQTNIVIVVIATCTGQHVSFLGADEAIAIGEQITNAGRQAKGGLIIAPPGFMPPSPPTPNGHS